MSTKNLFGAGTKGGKACWPRMCPKHPVDVLGCGPFPPDYVSIAEQTFQESYLGIIALDVKELIHPRSN